LRLPVASVTDNQPLANLVTDSMALIETIIEVQELYGIQLVHQDMRELDTVGDLINLLHSKMTGSSQVDFSDPSLLAMYEIAIPHSATMQDAA
jgi:acyl carrier protein